MENNPLIAVDVLTKLINSPEIAEYAFYLYYMSFLVYILPDRYYFLYFLFAYLWIQILYSTCQYGHESTLNGSCEQAYNSS